MSTLHAPARVAAPATRQPAPRRTASRPAPLRVVPPARRRTARAPFVVLVVGLLAGGLLGLLMLNTVLAQDAFVLQDLQRASAQLTDRQQALMQDVAAAQAPAKLAARASALGMVPSSNPAFIRLADGRVLGVPKPGVKPPAAKSSSKSTGKSSSKSTAKSATKSSAKAQQTKTATSTTAGKAKASTSATTSKTSKAAGAKGTTTTATGAARGGRG